MSVRLELKLKQGPKASGDEGRAIFAVTMDHWNSADWKLPLLYLPYTLVHHQPSQESLDDFETQGHMALTHVAEVEISALGEGGPEIKISKIELIEEHPKTGWVDEFGQRCCVDWPGKIKSEAQLKELNQRGVDALAAIKLNPLRDEYQAWSGGRRRDATGFFRLEELDGKWWLVAPSGRLFYAQGMDCVVDGIDMRLDAATRPAYQWLPPQPKGGIGGAWAAKQPGENAVEPFWPCFYRSNLIRKWGEDDFVSRFRTRAMARLAAWNFTCLGNWSDLELEKTQKFPYVTMGPPYWEADGKVSQIDYRFHDVFDPRFELAATQASSSLAATKDDPYLIGHFINNEMPWDDLPEAVLKANKEQPARLWLAAELAKEYGNIAALNDAWETDAASFDELRWPEEPNEAAKKDMGRFMYEFASRWYKGWAKGVRTADPNHLLLGDRFRWTLNWMELLDACAENMDVISINYYAFDIPRKTLDAYYAKVHKPMMIGEYDFNSLDAGLLTAAVPVADQEERGVGYRYYTERAAAAPYIVGAQYFQYLDEPVTGRFDRETSFNGFINVADVPYPALVKAAKASNAQIYEIHAGIIAPYERAPKR
jgi:hypothetical protein